MRRHDGHSLAILLGLLACGALMTSHMASAEGEYETAYVDEAGQAYEDALAGQDGTAGGQVLYEGEYEGHLGAAPPPFYGTEEGFYAGGDEAAYETVDHRNNGSQIVSLLDGNFCWEVPHPSAQSEAVHVWTCHSHHEQWWAYTHERTLLNTRTGGVLDAGDGAPGTPLAHRNYQEDVPGQRWTWNEAGDLQPDSNPDFCIGIQGGLMYQGALLEVASCKTMEGQRWSPGDCMDNEPLCQHWMSMGECYMNREFMIGAFLEDGTYIAGHCRASCRACIYHLPGHADEATVAGGALGHAHEAEGAQDAGPGEEL